MSLRTPAAGAFGWFRNTARKHGSIPTRDFVVQIGGEVVAARPTLTALGRTTALPITRLRLEEVGDASAFLVRQRESVEHKLGALLALPSRADARPEGLSVFAGTGCADVESLVCHVQAAF